MKNYTILISVLVLLSCISLTGYAQVSMWSGSVEEHELTPEEEKALQGRAIEKVASMNSYISYMASKRSHIEDRKYYREKALNLFIGKGYSFEEEGVIKEGVLMEVTSLNKTKNPPRLVRDYFSSLINLGYSDVDIQFTKIPCIKVTHLKQTGPDTYECTCEYDQYFRGYRDHVVVYKDKTTKRIKCIIKVEETEDSDAEYIIMLGDITAIKTERM